MSSQQTHPHTRRHSPALNIPLALRATRGGFKILSGLAPAVAARAAETLFCTPRRYSRPALEQAALASATPFHVRLGQQQLAAWRWGEGPSILMAHGWEGRGSQLYPFVAPLVEAGFSVVTWDAPAHGNSPGKRSSLPEFADAIWAVGRSVGEVRGVLGHSMGCAALSYACSEGLPIERAVFIAAPASLADYSVQFAGMVGISEHVRARMVDSMERRFQVRVADLDAESLRGPEGVPLLLIHDEDDREVSLESTRRIERVWPGAQVIVTHGLGHRRVLKDPAVIEASVAWLGAAPKKPARASF